MNRRAWASASAVAVASVTFAAAVADAAAPSHRVVAVDPDAELARALDLALSPWGVVVGSARVDSPADRMPLAADRARTIADDLDADVVVWVSSAAGASAVWIYDVASNHVSTRKLEGGPPFDATTAAGVALSVKTLLRGTVVAPPLERFGASPDGENATVWVVGLGVGGAIRAGAPSPFELRESGSIGVWPSGLAARWGFSFDVDTGAGLRIDDPSFSGSVSDTSLRLAIAARLPVAPALAVVPSIGAEMHFVALDGLLASDGSHVSVDRLDGGAEPRVALEVKAFGGHLRAGPWLGLSVLTRWQRFHVQDDVINLGPIALKGALSVALALP